ncbi:activating signal cointegrator 1 complex subunit 2 homolog [Eriocheir sinensis]|uniref:activating signal cointegrator 1 complex subunit 2 homolog n=1 Tax=Eriocheir sinensis TaxID=95602 RepID=UPI0021CA5580|nr:activating signal cointegrator 1 complex subunit 2 homolog [Eriocheir sinensis]
MPKTKQIGGRAKQRRPQADRPENIGADPEPETAERDKSLQSSISSVDGIPETQQDTLDTQRQPSSEEEATRQQKKRVRVSKKEIPEYRWTDEGERGLADLIKEYPQLYDKKQKEWLNVATKNSLWNRSATVTSSDDEDNDVQSTGSQSQAFTTTGKGKGSGPGPNNRDSHHNRRHYHHIGVTHIDLSEAVRQILSKADSQGASHSYTGHQKIVHDFVCLLEGHMQGIPEESWHEFQIDCLNLVHRYRQRRPLFQQSQQQPPMIWQGPQQQQPWQPLQQQQFWHPPQPATWQAPPQQQQQQQQPPASQPAPQPLLPPQPPLASQSSGQSSWTRTTEWEPRMPPAPSATLVQSPSPTPLVSPSVILKTPVTSPSFPGLTPGSVGSILERSSPSTPFTSKDLNTPKVHRVSPGSGPSISKDTE